MTKALVVLSGGQDSTTCLIQAIDKYDYVEAITFDYGQRNKKEIEVSKNIANILNVKQTIVNAKNINELTFNAMTKNVDIKHENGEVPNTFVAGRNQYFLTLASIYAYENNIHNIITGVSDTESSGYPDCSREFIKSFNQTINLALNTKLNIVTPLIYKSKLEVWQLAEELNCINFIEHNTLTCYNGVIGEGCGECPSCILRNKSYKKFIERKGV